MIKFDKLTPPAGDKIEIKDGKLAIPDKPIISRIEGDGIGPDISKASKRIWDAAVEIAYGGKRAISWLDIYAGDAAKQRYDEWLPKDTLKAIEHYIVAIKGPLTTPIGGGFRSLNVSFRQILELYACVRPVRYFEGVPSPVKHPEKLNVVVFRENTEDVYAGIEYQQGNHSACEDRVNVLPTFEWIKCRIRRHTTNLPDIKADNQPAGEW